MREINRPQTHLISRTYSDTAPYTYALIAAVITIGWGAIMIWLSLQRVLGYNAGMLDLGAMAQAVASVLRGQPLVTTGPNGNFSRLAGHVELFYFLLAPLWALWPDPRTLVVTQALLYMSGAFPAYRLGARAARHPLGGLCFSLIYLFYPVALTAVLFDFHGDTLAMPFMLFALDAVDRRAWRSFTFWAILAASCKFYVAGPLGLIGLIAWWQYGERRIGLTIFLSALAYGLFTFLIIRPLFDTRFDTTSGTSLYYINYYFGQIATVAESWIPRLVSAMVVFAPAILLAGGGWRWLLPALPLAFAALISTGPGGSYHYGYHHYALVAPFVLMACAEGVRRVRALAEAGRTRRHWQADLAISAVLVILTTVLLVDTPLNPRFWSGAPNNGFDHSVYGVTTRDRLKDRFLAEYVPPQAPIATSQFLATQLVNRDTLYLTRYANDLAEDRLSKVLPQVEYVVADALFDFRVVGQSRIIGGAAYDQPAIAALLRDPDFGLIAANDGVLIFARNPGTAVMSQAISARPPSTGEPVISRMVRWNYLLPKLPPLPIVAIAW
ncbi:MAG: DUF2079 domain-containing protein [Oscillochloris sp.]|nr:DUF2079 domain-containing protein [Oscillochloris sp.]